MRRKRTIAIGVVIVWTSLYGIHMADTLEDAQEESAEPIDRQVTQALAMPAEQSLSLPELPFASVSSSSDRAVISPVPILNLRLLLAASATSHTQFAKGPPPRAKPPLFRGLSVYRL